MCAGMGHWSVSCHTHTDRAEYAPQLCAWTLHGAMHGVHATLELLHHSLQLQVRVMPLVLCIETCHMLEQQ